VIYNGTDPEGFSAGTETGRVVLSVGNLISIKGHELLVRAIAALQDKHPDVTCDIVGEGPERDRLIALAQELRLQEKMHFLGRRKRSQVAEAMRSCTVFALPSRYEALGCVYLEAMAAEKPVIGCTGQGIEEVIQPGVNGLLINPDDLEALTRSLSMLLDDQEMRRRLGRSARHTILHGFTLSDQAAQLSELYREFAA
jgi:glycosyltransferase involved in cell wall biosynthesis